MLGHVTGFITDEDHGLERLTGVVQQRQCFPEAGRECNAVGDTIESTGLCYQGSTCVCAMNSGALEWQCSAP
jgi:hypothetical protein